LITPGGLPAGFYYGADWFKAAQPGHHDCNEHLCEMLSVEQLGQSFGTKKFQVLDESERIGACMILFWNTSGRYLTTAKR
jgi:hypothetical protein